MTDRLQMLMAAHYEFVKAGGLPEGSRPYTIQSRLDTLEKFIMEEIENAKAVKNDIPPRPIINDDDIPF